MTRRTLLVLLPFACRLGGQGKGKGKSRSDAGTHPAFAKSDVDILVAYFAQPGGLPPGLDKRESLPPGLEKHLRKRGSLPPGLQKKVVALPPDLNARLTPLPAGYRRVIVDRWAMILAEATNVVWDIAEVIRR
jgi:hypothetical protein